jgi:spore germination protein YaaH
MKRRIFLLVFVLAGLLVAAAHAVAAKPTALFYLGTNPDSVRSFFAHSKQIDLLVPTWYDLDENGMVTGEPDPAVLEEAHREKLPVMPISPSSTRRDFTPFRESAGVGAHDRGDDPRSQAQWLLGVPVRL